MADRNGSAIAIVMPVAYCRSVEQSYQRGKCIWYSISSCKFIEVVGGLYICVLKKRSV
ncbi:MAG: hypothetical protein ACLRXQ_10935 [Phascolarctobacterium faecium]